DASDDDTGKRLDDISWERLTVLRHPENQGVGGAMVTGYRYALDAGADIVIKVDGDSQMDPKYMIDLIKPLTKEVCDYTKGNRFLHFDALSRMPVSRKIGNVLLTFLTKASSGYWHVFDPQNGYVAIRRDVLAAIDMRRIQTSRYFFENEMLVQLNILTARVLDCPMPAIYLADSPSSLRIIDVMQYYPGLLIRGFFYRLFYRYLLRDFSIIVPFYLIGSMMCLWGGLFGGYNWWYHATQAHQATPTGTIMLAVLPFLLGFQLLLAGLVIDIFQSPRADASPVPKNDAS
ncbi:MAG: glycosyltransferase family 2 protein, partial [candidate division Zixibacteria bacterium]|nr:glycosyltransferase family 2 protein [candidate division Zixibacteria bacterium]